MMVDESVQVQRLHYRLLVTEEVLRRLAKQHGVPDEVVEHNLDNVNTSALQMYPESAR